MKEIYKINVNDLNNYLDKKIEPCGGEVNLPIVQGYQWDGDESIQNKNKPTTIIKPIILSLDLKNLLITIRVGDISRTFLSRGTSVSSTTSEPSLLVFSSIARLLTLILL